MYIKRVLDDFQVEEHIHFPGEQGAYNYYRVEKRNASMRRVREAMAAQLGVTPSAVTFPAPRDMAAVAVQYASVRKHGPLQFQGQGFVAHCVQQGPRALRTKDLRGNHFNVMVRHLTKSEAETLGNALEELASCGLPNYFDDQRFTSLTQKGFIGKTILLCDTEEILHIYLSEPMRGDPKPIQEFKKLVKNHWGQWGYLLHLAPRPSNLHSVITYLKDHPHNYDRAANLIQDRLLNSYLLAYQSWLWNHILARYLQRYDTQSAHIDIAGTQFPLPDLNNEVSKLRKLEIELPRLTAYYPTELFQVVKGVLESEGLTQQDFNVRLLRRVYLTKRERPIWFAPTDVEIGKPIVDEYAPNFWATPVNFTLPLGHYAILVLKAAAARLGAPFKA
ncbi:MAG: tRNA pseudouridine(13) synthase TruD [Anaerolineae bacterium]|nr:tRNA pseudouridine(13) synthase TruD [Anaerolineae bacterium]